MALPPLTHHDILELVGPFSQRGLKVDLDATDRLERRLRFKPVTHSAIEGAPAVTEQVELHHLYRGTYRLTRTYTAPDAPLASVQAEGPDPGELLERLTPDGPAQAFTAVEGGVVAFRRERLRVQLGGGWETPLVLRHVEVVVRGLTLAMRMPTVSGPPAELTLVDTRATEGRLRLPDDVLAVLGWAYSPLSKVKGATAEWTTKLSVRGPEPTRSRLAEARVVRAAQHLAVTLVEPPERFHQRYGASRWGVVARRLIPVFTCVGVTVISYNLPRDIVDWHPAMREILMTVPLAIIALSFTLQAGSRIELPTLPRAFTGPSWRTAD